MKSWKNENLHISIHCWQGDDVAGFETLAEGLSGGGIMATGNYPGRARNGDELRQDIEKAMNLIPGKHKINLHAMYAETDGSYVDRDKLEVSHFSKWIDWAKSKGIGIDFNPTYFAHKMADDGFTLSSRDESIREFWIEHGKRCRKIAAEIGKELGIPCVNNVWIPDGSKDFTVSRLEHRLILKKLSMKYLAKSMIKTIYWMQLKVSFWNRIEAYVGSHNSMSYALTRDVMLCLDAGHFINRRYSR